MFHGNVGIVGQLRPAVAIEEGERKVLHLVKGARDLRVLIAGVAIIFELAGSIGGGGQVICGVKC